MIATLWAKVSGYLLAVSGGIAALFAIWLNGRQRGKAVMREEHERHRREAIANKRKLDSEIDDLGPADVDHRFRQWVRKE